MPYEFPKYPDAIFDDTDFPNQVDNTDWVYAWLVNALKEELQACLTELGTDPKGEHADVKARIEAIEEGEDKIGEGHITILPWSYVGISGNWAKQVSGNYYLYSTIASADNGGYLTFQVCLGAGTYSLMLMVAKGANKGIVDIDIDDTEVASFDTYDVGSINDYRCIQANIEISTGGVKTIKVRIDGKNDDSTNYRIDWNYMVLYRTA